ncbi:hypothetical protein Tco_1214743 [Tanacetum coccineum]
MVMMTGGGVASWGGSSRGRGWGVEESRTNGDRIDRAIRTIFGFGRKSHRKSFPVAGDGDGGGGGVAGGSPRADDHEYLELLGMPEDPYVEAALQAPPSPDYVPGPEEPEQAPPSPDYIPGPEHTDDEIVAEDQPDAEDASPTAQSPDYVPESDPEADPEEDDDEDPEEDPVDYSADGGDDGDDEDEPSEEDEDDDVDMEADGDEEEEEHPAPADSVVVALPATDQAPSAEETEPFETDESAATPNLPHPAIE